MADCLVENDGNWWKPGFEDDDEFPTGFHASSISRFLSIAQEGLRDSVKEEGGRVCKEGDGLYSSPTIEQVGQWMVANSETIKDRCRHVITYEIIFHKDATKRRKRGSKLQAYVTPAQSVMPLFLYYVVYESLKL